MTGPHVLWFGLLVVSHHHLAGLVDIAAAEGDDQIALPGVLLAHSAASSRLFTRTEPGIWAASFALVMLGSLGSRLPMMGVSTVIKIHSLIQFLLCEYIDRSNC